MCRAFVLVLERDSQARTAGNELGVAKMAALGPCRKGFDNGYALVAYSAGKMREHQNRILADDRVTLEILPYGLIKGRITFRHFEG